MVYEFICPIHGYFTLEQPLYVEHLAVCPKCGQVAIRKFSSPGIVMAGQAFRPDGSYRQEKDYDILKG